MSIRNFPHPQTLVEACRNGFEDIFSRIHASGNGALNPGESERIMKQHVVDYLRAKVMQYTIAFPECKKTIDALISELEG